MTTPHPHQPDPIRPDQPVMLSDLVPGRLIRRYTDATRAGVFAPLPCHGDRDRQAVKLDPGKAAATAVCRMCSRTYDVELTADIDGGHWADFVVSYKRFILSSARRT